MAGAPRRVSGGGLTGLHYGLISFVILTVASLAGFIYQLTIVKQYEDEARRYRTRAENYGEPPPYYVEEAQARKTPTFRVMDDDRKKLVTLVTGVSEGVGATVERDVDLLLQQVRVNNPSVINEGDALLTAVRNLDRALTTARRDATARGDEVKKLQADNVALNASIKAAKDDFAAQIDAMNGRLADLAADVQKFQEEKNHQLAAIQTSASADTEERNRERSEWRLKEKQLELEIATLDNRLATTRTQLEELKPTAFDPAEILTKADGRVLRAIPGSSVIYVNLGEDDGVKIGMSFEVFSQTRERGDSLRGKASVEITSLTPMTAECRITRGEPGRPIIEGDVLVNISFERGRKPKFLVAGKFDLNYDGIEDFDGSERIASMIREWGGQIVAQLDPTTDFVIVGAPPRTPAVLNKDTDVVADQKRKQEAELTEFKDLIVEARSLFVPVINQNQFLFLTGYAGG